MELVHCLKSILTKRKTKQSKTYASCRLVGKSATREGAKGNDAPLLSKSKLRKKINYRIVLIFLCLGDL